MTNILCTIKGFTQDAAIVLNEVGTVTYKQPTQDALPSLVVDTNILIVQLGLNVDRAVLDAAKNLKIIATATTGLDHIDVEYAKNKGITIISLKDESAFLKSITSTAELALGMMISLARNIPSAIQSVLAGNWDRESHRGISLSTKTLGIIGMGRLGRMMAQYGKGLGMNVLFSDPKVAGGVTLEELLQTADVISLHVHLDEHTKNLINETSLKIIKTGALLINTARGNIVDEAAVIKALESKKLGGYATDVLSDELSFINNKATSALIEYAMTHRNVIITPHIGGTTVESRQATDIFISNKVNELLQNYETK